MGKDGLGESWPIRSQLPAFLKPLPTSLGWPQSQDPQVLRRVPGVGGGGQCLVEPLVIQKGSPALKRDKEPIFRSHLPLRTVSTRASKLSWPAARRPWA